MTFAREIITYISGALRNVLVNSNHRRVRFSHGGIGGCLDSGLRSGDLLRAPGLKRFFPFDADEFVIDFDLGGELFGG